MNLARYFIGALAALCLCAPLFAQTFLSFPNWTTPTRPGSGSSPGTVGFNTQTNLPEYLDNNAAWHSFAASGSTTIVAGSTPTTGFTSGHIISTTGSVAVDSGIAAANVAQNGSAANFTSIGNTSLGTGAFSTLSTNGVTTFGGSIRAPVRTASSPSDNISAASDYFICAFNSSSSATENLPAAPATGLTFLIKDCSGNAGTNNITITPAAGNIDGSATFVMNTNYQSVAVTYTGSQWSLN